ncbi:MAG: hypothetical protein WC389_14195 [Lutibacter sp.]|jgi:uncharacterized ion transporter superfamily protein YfcC
MKDFLKNYWWVTLIVITITAVLTWGIPKGISVNKEKKQVIQDSITELNTLWKNEQRGNAQTFYILDSLSKTGESIAWTNFQKQVCFIKVTPQK